MEKTHYPIYVADYTTQNYLYDDVCMPHERYFVDYFNATYFARDIAKCEDVVGYIRIVNNVTGEIQFEIEAGGAVSEPMPTEKKEEEPISDNDTSIDIFGYTWKEQPNGHWSLDCTGITCQDCIYHSTNDGDCRTDDLTLEDIQDRIAEIE